MVSSHGWVEGALLTEKLLKRPPCCALLSHRVECRRQLLPLLRLRLDCLLCCAAASGVLPRHRLDAVPVLHATPAALGGRGAMPQLRQEVYGVGEHVLRWPSAVHELLQVRMEGGNKCGRNVGQ